MSKGIPSTAIPIGSKELLVSASRFLTNESIEGEDISRFESDFATYLGVDQIFTFNTGRTALYLALQALNLKRGDEVIVPAYTCPIVFEVVLRLGLKPVFVDVGLETCNMKPELISKAITPRTRAIIPVHLFGRPCEMDRITEISESLGLYLIEDAAQALGATFKDQKVGSFGDLAIFSFGPGKSITGGEGGALAVNNPELSGQIAPIYTELPSTNWMWILHAMKNVIAMRVFSNHLYTLIKRQVERSVEKNDEMILHNCLSLLEERPSLNPTIQLAKMPNLSAAIIREQLVKAEEFNEKRIANANKLTALFAEMNGKKVGLPKTDPNVRSTFTRYVVRVIGMNRELVVDDMLRHNIDVIRPYHYIGTFLEKMSRKKYLHARKLSNSLIALPNHPLVTESDILDSYKAFCSVNSARAEDREI